MSALIFTATAFPKAVIRFQEPYNMMVLEQLFLPFFFFESYLESVGSCLLSMSTSFLGHIIQGQPLWKKLLLFKLFLPFLFLYFIYLMLTFMHIVLAWTLSPFKYEGSSQCSSEKHYFCHAKHSWITMIFLKFRGQV